MVYEYRGMVMHRTSTDGLTWEAPTFVPATGIWATDFQSCAAGSAIDAHPLVTRLSSSIGRLSSFIRRRFATRILQQGDCHARYCH